MDMHTIARFQDEQETALNRALDMIMACGRVHQNPPLVEYAPKLTATNHHLHICGCGDFYVCSQEPDKCPVIEPWTCLACELDQQDQHLNALEVDKVRR